MTNELNFKELYEVSLKSTLPIEVSGTKIEAGETIASFDRIQIANFQEIKSVASANGGWDNRAHIFWETTKEVKERMYNALNDIETNITEVVLNYKTNLDTISDNKKSAKK